MNDSIKLTGLWKQKSKDGVTYLTGSLSPTSRLFVMPNKQKQEGSKEPDYILYLKSNKKDKDTKDKDNDNDL